MYSTRFTLIASIFALPSALAHCQLAWPLPLHSPLNPAVPNDIKDYSMTAPLVTSGTYPCKGYINNPSSQMYSVASWQAGETYNYTIAGTATHGGGSCQLSMSYDKGQTWNVIYSVMGGCLVDGMTEPFVIPKDAPSGEALFSWSWFNLLGNREMYQNCAVVTISNGGKGLDSLKYPTPFVANVGTSINDCVTIENTAVVFPNPGSNVKYGGTYASTRPTTPAGFTGSNCVGPGATYISNANAEPASVSASSSAPTFINAPPSASTLYTVPTSEYATASIASTAQAMKTQCRRRKRSVDGHIHKREERFVRRPIVRDGVKRVAAVKAEHIRR